MHYIFLIGLILEMKQDIILQTDFLIIYSIVIFIQTILFFKVIYIITRNKTLFYFNTDTEEVNYFNYEVHGTLTYAEYIDKNGLFVGNHHFPIPEAFTALAKL